VTNRSALSSDEMSLDEMRSDPINFTLLLSIVMSEHLEWYPGAIETYNYIQLYSLLSSTKVKIYIHRENIYNVTFTINQNKIKYSKK